MSRRTEAISSARGAAKGAHGSHLTIQARQGTMERVVESAWARGQQVNGIEGIKERHISAYIAERQAAGVGMRTLQTEMSHIRTSMTAAGREQAARSGGISTKALGLGGESREGKRPPATSQQTAMAGVAAFTKDAGLGATVELQRALGLRKEEAIMGCRSLNTWAKRLGEGSKIMVIFGTKGGRPREVTVPDQARALAAVNAAQAVAGTRGGKIIAGDLKQADNTFKNTWNRHIGPASGITSHQLRGAFAQERYEKYRAEGFTKAESLARTSADLGHGDGRGRYVERVYLHGYDAQ